jgi:hypothetical protein
MGDFWDEVLRLGLIVGAIFQLLCISAVVWIPSEEKREKSDTADDSDAADDAVVAQKEAQKSHRKSGSRVKSDNKKKRR